jgi:peptidoglycan/LPS O-acetylase OafA/YrhL
MVAVLASFAVGFAFDGFGTGASAALGAALAFGNFAASAYLIVWAAERYSALLAMIAFGGFFLRMGVIVGVTFALNTLPFFSPVAFVAALVPLTVVLLAFEAKVMAGPAGREITVTSQDGAAS